jgi:pyruvate kinase
MTPKEIRKRRTKIVATLGPASSTAEVIGDLLDSGVNVFRLNFSHGSHEQHANNIAIVRAQAEQRNRHIGILGDLQGPKIRIGDLQTPEKLLIEDQDLTLTTDINSADSENDRVHVVYEPLPTSVNSGDTLLLDDGLIRLQVSSVSGVDVVCKVVQAGVLKPRKGINRLGGGLSADAITEKDLEDLEVIIAHELEYVAVSFPCCADDLLPVKNALKKHNSDAKIIAKIERAEAVETEEQLKELINAADAVMVARGDLGVEIGDAQLIGIQKRIIRLSRQANKPVITATQMMESMITQPVPTRAEVFDVANAVLDGTDAVMLSGETAAGKFPSKVVQAMAETAQGAELHPMMSKSSYRVERVFDSIDESIAMAAMYAANHLNDISAIICLTESGTTPLLASRLSSKLPIYGVSRNRSTCRRMALYRGVIPMYFDVTKANGDIWSAAMDLIAERGELLPGQRVAMTCGDLQGEGGSTNTLKILQYRK